MLTFRQKLMTTLYIIKHKSLVMYYIFKVIWALIKRGLKHDLTKFSKEEFEYVYILSTKGKNVKFGTQEYYNLVDSIVPAKNAHHFRNSHHPEYYEGDIEKMSALDVLEMLVDWTAATKRNKGNLLNSVQINAQEFKIQPKRKIAILSDLHECKFL